MSFCVFGLFLSVTRKLTYMTNCVVHSVCLARDVVDVCGLYGRPVAGCSCIFADGFVYNSRRLSKLAAWDGKR